MDTEVITGIIADQMFDVLASQSVLELGPFNGWFTKQILNYTDRVTCVEFNDGACDTISDTFRDSVTVVNEDFHAYVKTAKQFDAVVVYGVLYHSCAPLMVLEDIANQISPKYILLESHHHDPEYPHNVKVNMEIPNLPGERYADSKTCGISLSLSKTVMELAVNNLGYIKQREFNLADSFRFHSNQSPFAKSKESSIYLLFEKA